MEVLFDALRRVGVWLLALVIGGVGLLVILRALLPELASVTTAFIATPGGLLIVIVAWRYSTRGRRK